ncbi:MAG: xanthine dehydrogenase accessory protein XdhC [Pseudomonadota bacterium]
MSLASWLTSLTEPAVLVTVIESKGSVPRGVGTKMLVTASGQQGSIGGGELEWRTVAAARRLVGAHGGDTLAFPLGPELGQCCGGFARVALTPLHPVAATHEVGRALGEGARTFVQNPTDGRIEALTDRSDASTIVQRADGALIEAVPPPMAPVWLFGAGHVGRALVDVLARLPEQMVVWIDERPEVWPTDLPEAIRPLPAAVPEAVVAHAPAGADVLVMTHSHARDLAVVAAALDRDDLGFVGLIGSRTKRARFERRLLSLGHDDAGLARLTCPIGLPSIRGKAPEIIAIAVAAQLLERRADG